MTRRARDNGQARWKEAFQREAERLGVNPLDINWDMILVHFDAGLGAVQAATAIYAHRVPEEETP